MLLLGYTQVSRKKASERIQGQKGQHAAASDACRATHSGQSPTTSLHCSLKAGACRVSAGPGGVSEGGGALCGGPEGHGRPAHNTGGGLPGAGPCLSGCMQ